MLVTRQNIFIQSSPTTVWEYVYHVNAWPQWIRSLRTIELLETPKINAKGKLFFKREKIAAFNISNLQVGKYIQVETPLLWSQMTFNLRLLDVDNGTAATIEAYASGFWEKVVAKLLGRRIARSLHDDLVTLKSITESTEITPPKEAASH